MKFQLSFLTCIAVVSISGQFLGSEYIVDSVPLHRRRLSNVRYEIQPSVSREIEYHETVTTKSSNQGRRHIENRHINKGGNSRNVKEFEAIPYESIHPNKNQNYEYNPATRHTNNNREHQVNHDNQYSARIQQQTQENNTRQNNMQHTNQNNRNKGNINPITYDSNLKTNVENTNPSQDTSLNQQSYPSNDNVRTNVNSDNQQMNTRVYGNSGRNEPSLRTNANNGNIVNVQTQNTYSQQNYPSNENARTNSQKGDRAYGNSPISHNSRNTEATLRAIDSYNYENSRNVDSSTNKNNEGKLNRQNTDKRRENENRNHENNRQSTEPSKRITTEDRFVTSSTKPSQDNEVVSKIYPDGRSGNKDGEKWIWSGNGSEKTVKYATTTLPSVDDRAAFAGDKCPTGQVRFNNICVDTD